MRRLIFFSIASLILPLFSTACGPSESEIRDAVRDGIRNAYQERTLDLGYKLGRRIVGTIQDRTEIRHFRFVDKVSGQVFDQASRTERIIGRELVVSPPSDDLEIVYNTWKYYAEVSTTNHFRVVTTETIVTPNLGGPTIIDKVTSRSYFTDLVGIAFYRLSPSGDLRTIENGLVLGDPSSLTNLYGLNYPSFIGKKDPQQGEIFELNLSFPSLFSVIGTEDYPFAITVNGQPQTIKATRIEVKFFVSNPNDPTGAYLTKCLNWIDEEFFNQSGSSTITSKGQEVTSIDCPDQILSATIYWYQNIPIRFEGRVASAGTFSDDFITADQTASGGTVYRKTDPGFGFEYITQCDPDRGDANTNPVDCRFFDPRNDTNVCISAPCPGTRERRDFSTLTTGKSKYAHIQFQEDYFLWQATEIRDEPLQ
jgi:hypothetical protein